MAARTGTRLSVSQAASVAVAETKLLARGASGVARDLGRFVAWALACIGLGLGLGLAAAYLPPIGALGIVAAVGAVLLWMMPDLPLVSRGLIRKAFFVMLIADLCIPNYYMIQIAGLPWISARRVITFILIVPFLIAIGSSADVRSQLMERIRPSLLIFVCAICYFVMATLSIATSVLPGDSTSALMEAMLSWYVPFFAIIYVARDTDDVIFILKIICFCAIFITFAGSVSFFMQHNPFLDVFPGGMLANMVANNPSMQNLLPSAYDFRNGLYRARSVFASPLSFGEFEIIVIPIGVFFAVHRKSFFERALGALVIGGVFGIFFAGARGGWIGFLTSLIAFVLIWTIRKAINNRVSLGPALVGLIGALSSVVVIGLIIFWPKAHNMVLGGGDAAASTEARHIQWVASLPYIESNPITGHGLGAGSTLISVPLGSIDSYVLSLLLDTGIPGFVFFAGLILAAMWYGLRNYFSDMSGSDATAGAAAGALACCFIAFIMYRLVLSERENHNLIFFLLGLVVVLNYEYARKRIPGRLSHSPPRKTQTKANHRAEGALKAGEPAL